MTIVGYGIVNWLREKGPASVVAMAEHFAEDPGSEVETYRMLHVELRALEAAGAVEKVLRVAGRDTAPVWQAFEPQGGQA